MLSALFARLIVILLARVIYKENEIIFALDMVKNLILSIDYDLIEGLNCIFKTNGKEESLIIFWL